MHTEVSSYETASGVDLRQQGYSLISAGVGYTSTLLLLCQCNTPYQDDVAIWWNFTISSNNKSYMNIPPNTK